MEPHRDLNRWREMCKRMEPAERKQMTRMFERRARKRRLLRALSHPNNGWLFLAACVAWAFQRAIPVSSFAYAGLALLLSACIAGGLALVAILGQLHRLDLRLTWASAGVQIIAVGAMFFAPPTGEWWGLIVVGGYICYITAEAALAGHMIELVVQPATTT